VRHHVARPPTNACNVRYTSTDSDCVVPIAPGPVLAEEDKAPDPSGDQAQPQSPSR
jgi:hypothetical protein